MWLINLLPLSLAWEIIYKLHLLIWNISIMFPVRNVSFRISSDWLVGQHIYWACKPMFLQLKCAFLWYIKNTKKPINEARTYGLIQMTLIQQEPWRGPFMIFKTFLYVRHYLPIYIIICTLPFTNKVLKTQLTCNRFPTRLQNITKCFPAPFSCHETLVYMYETGCVQGVLEDHWECGPWSRINEESKGHRFFERP